MGKGKADKGEKILNKYLVLKVRNRKGDKGEKNLVESLGVY